MSINEKNDSQEKENGILSFGEHHAQNYTFYRMLFSILEVSTTSKHFAKTQSRERQLL